MDAELGVSMRRASLAALIVGGTASLLIAAGAWAARERFFEAYLFAYLFWICIALGCLGWLMIHHLVGGGWGRAIRRPLEAGTSTLKWLALLFVPLVFGLGDLFVWARPAAVAADPQLRHLEPYLNTPFFLGRAAAYLLIWNVLGYLLVRWSRRESASPDPELQRRLTRLSAGGLILYGITVTLASVDWVMSLEPHWQSTEFGMIFAIGQLLVGLAFALLVAALLARRDNRGGQETAQHLNDLGNLLLALVMGWIYLSFMQYLVMWSGNLPSNVRWYIARIHGGWQWVGLFVLVLGVALPFALLLSRALKRCAGVLLWVAASVLAAQLADMFWLVAPTFSEKVFRLSWMDGAAPVALGGLWIAAYIARLRRLVVLPLRSSTASGE